jgi:hypothetical protein
MSHFEDRSVSFILRIRIVPGSHDPDGPQWRGSIENVASGERRFVRDFDALAAFIRAGLDLARDAEPPIP